MSKRIFSLLRRLLRNHGVNACFLLAFTLFFYGNLLLLSHWMRLEFLNSYNNTPYNAYAVRFLLSSETQALLDLRELAAEGGLKQCVLFRSDRNSNSRYEVIYFDEASVAFQDKSISDWDWASGTGYAAAGVDSGWRLGDVIVEEGKEYPVSGILDRHISEAVNYGVFYTDSRIDAVDLAGSYILTSQTNQNVKRAFSRLSDFLGKNEITVKKIYIRTAEFRDYIQYDQFLIPVLFFLALFYLLLIYAAKKIWSAYKKPDIFVRTVLGESSVSIKVSLEYLLLRLLAFILSIIMIAFTPGIAFLF